MGAFSKTSEDNLKTCDSDIQTLFNYIIKYMDCSVIFGNRTPEKQFELFKQGRILKNGIWEVENKSKIVTYKDGFIEKSKHNYIPSKAVDVVPYPSLYSDEKKLIEFGGFVMGVATMLKAYNAIDKDITWGGNWKWKDYAHYQVI